MGKRPRRINELIGEVIVDELAYSENKGSKKARKVTEKSEQVHIEIWYDKHYVNRVQFGDEDGKRSGIDESDIKDLVSNSICHLIYYAFQIKNFSFVNSKKLSTHSTRVVLQKEAAEGLLNVAVGFYHIVDNKYEVTVFTAMVSDAFRISDGQYTILIDGANSALFKMDNRKLVEMDSNP
ncbi:hypothetical protein HDC92_000591 [Pedobacter sp. AK017]|uniref:hypothetical protein n=1 Tax=Pedobacter sp. AK017 TaxID=2723073 RepID=UPI001617FB84|nr:hypothetical protein [Pedobacter sp. AK017]MBB5436927.1 hypothetical protein [Pedobacter sp. AK017]